MLPPYRISNDSLLQRDERTHKENVNRQNITDEALGRVTDLMKNGIRERSCNFTRKDLCKVPAGFDYDFGKTANIAGNSTSTSRAKIDLYLGS